LIVEPGLYMLLRFQKPAVRKNYETGNQAFSIRLRFLTTESVGAVGKTSGVGGALRIDYGHRRKRDRPTLGLVRFLHLCRGGTAVG